MLGTIKTTCAALALSSLASLAAAQPLALRITGPDQNVRVFDLDALDALPQTEFVTGTIWTDGRTHFSGVPLAVLLEQVGFDGGEAGQVELVALNDYRVEIPIDEIEPTSPIVATRVDGEPMPVREKGPFWVVYPYDAGARYRTEDIFTRSIWQLAQVRATR
ncbi:molybdopterin-dependent oxidoreductase [Limimaricola cinnabarinus]|jgi:hypothetical protein|uniref:molybdopterin-dependent oxidoreductase n=1 Tax=Limimaricola cinnabarinus TaxID=1125964 RepID=UPI00249314F7|nr:molybdopterin-dependent oxidoreductase [Limimaricola cinnabarinus]